MPRQKIKCQELQWLRQSVCDVYVALRPVLGDKKNKSVGWGHRVPSGKRATGHNQLAVHCSQVTAVPETAVAVQDSDSKNFSNTEENR